MTHQADCLLGVSARRITWLGAACIEERRGRPEPLIHEYCLQEEDAVLTEVVRCGKRRAETPSSALAYAGVKLRNTYDITRTPENPGIF